MKKLEINERIEVFAKYLGTGVWIRNIHECSKTENLFGKLIGVQATAILVELKAGPKLWFNLIDECPSYEFKLLLKPLSKLSKQDLRTARTSGSKFYNILLC